MKTKLTREQVLNHKLHAEVGFVESCPHCLQIMGEFQTFQELSTGGNMSYSIIIPCYNEEKRLLKSSREIDLFKRRHPNSEIIIVDDGSSDNTIMVALKLGYKVVVSGENKGKWSAIKRGVSAAINFTIVLADADLSVGLEDAVRLNEELTGRMIVIGDRYKGRNDMPAVRKFISRCFNFIVVTIGGVRVNDSQCPMKVFRNVPRVRQIFRDIQEDRWAGDVELLKLCRIRGLKIKEIPVRYMFGSDSRVNALKAAPEMFFSVIRIRLRGK